MSWGKVVASASLQHAACQHLHLGRRLPPSLIQSFAHGMTGRQNGPIGSLVFVSTKEKSVTNKGSKMLTQVIKTRYFVSERSSFACFGWRVIGLQISKVIVDVFVWFGGTDDETMMAIHNGVQ